MAQFLGGGGLSRNTQAGKGTPHMPKTKELQKKEREHRNSWSRTCDHPVDWWCQDCLARPEAVTVRLPDGTLSRGYIIMAGSPSG